MRHLKAGLFALALLCGAAFAADAQIGIERAGGAKGITEDAPNAIAVRSGTSAQALRVYGTYTDASNYERGEVVASATGLTITHTAAGTGVVRNITIARPVTFGGGSVVFAVGTEPTCNAAARGTVVLVAGSTGVADTFRICAKDAIDVYAYRPLT